jgi:hybrid cluster-associated redox disulfide protein
MRTDILTLQTPLIDLFERWPQTIPVFLGRRMACVGCQLSKFETLAGAIEVYGLNGLAFLSELQSAIDAA